MRQFNAILKLFVLLPMVATLVEMSFIQLQLTITKFGGLVGWGSGAMQRSNCRHVPQPLPDNLPFISSRFQLSICQ